MKNKLLSILLLTYLLTSCSQDDAVTQQTNLATSNYQTKKISYRQLTYNTKAFKEFEKFKVKKQASLNRRGVYDENFGVVIDTSNIVLISKDNYQSITFRIIDDSKINQVDNLILHKDVSGNYNAYIAEYSLSPSEKREIENGVTIPLKLPNSISNVQNSSKISIGGDGSDCLEIKTESISVCRDKNGNEIPNNGELGNGCVGMPYETVQFVFVIDAGCLSNGGGSGGGSNPYVPTDPGNGYEGGGHGGGGNSGDGTGYYPSNPGTGDGTGNTPTPQTPGLADQDGNPLVTTPILIDDSSFRFFRSLTPEQNSWWDDRANAEYTQDMTQYLLQHSYSEEAINFVTEIIDDIVNNPFPEGNDGGGDFNFSDYDFVETQLQDLPRRNIFYNNFPKNPLSPTRGMPSGGVYNLVGNNMNRQNDLGNINYQNACAIRVCRALNYSTNANGEFAYRVPVFFNKRGEQKSEKGDDNLNYILDAESLLAYMLKTFRNNPPIHLVNKTPVEIKEELTGKWGIYIILPKDRAAFGASGHADFWSDTGAITGSYLDKAKEVYFWELF